MGKIASLKVKDAPRIELEQVLSLERVRDIVLKCSQRFKTIKRVLWLKTAVN